MTVYLRAFVAVCAVFLATVICIVERHVVIVFSQPATYSNALHHKCGLLLLGCVVWMLFETPGLLLAGATAHTPRR